MLGRRSALSRFLARLAAVAAWALTIGSSHSATFYIRDANHPDQGWPHLAGVEVTAIDGLSVTRQVGKVVDTAFDREMRSKMSPGTVIYLGPGTFLTLGVESEGHPQDYAPGWRMQNNCHLIGSGKGLRFGGGTKTTLRLAGYNAAYQAIVVGSNKSAANSNMVVKNIEIDCNAPRLIFGPPYPPANFQGVELNTVGGGCSITGVLVRNAVGYSVIESFIMSINCMSPSATNEVAIATNNRIEDCDILEFLDPDNTGHCSGITLGRYDLSRTFVTAGYIQGIVTNCYVNFHTNSDPASFYCDLTARNHGGEFAYNAVRTKDSVFANNQSFGANRGFNNDTPWNEGLFLNGNDFYVPGHPDVNKGGVGFNFLNAPTFSTLAHNRIHIFGPNAIGVEISPPRLPLDLRNYVDGPVLGANDLTICSNSITADDVPGAPPWEGKSMGINCTSGYGQTIRVDLLSNSATDPEFDRLINRTSYAESLSGCVHDNIGPGFISTLPDDAPHAVPAPATIPLVDYGRDFHHDGFVDVVATNRSGRIYPWCMWTSEPRLPFVWDYDTYVNAIPNPLTWQIVGMADVDKDGVADLIFQDAVSRQIAYWLLNRDNTLKTTGLAYYQDRVTCASSTWDVVAVGKFNGDAEPDLFFQDAYNQLAVWHMDGILEPGKWVLKDIAFVGFCGQDEKVVGCGDFNRDGQLDLLCQMQGEIFPDLKGDLSLYFLDYRSGAPQATPGYIFPPYPCTFDDPPVRMPDWRVVAVGDYNHDNHVDILFQTAPSGGELKGFLMTRTNRLVNIDVTARFGSSAVRLSLTGRTIVGPR